MHETLFRFRTIRFFFSVYGIHMSPFFTVNGRLRPCVFDLGGDVAPEIVEIGFFYQSLVTKFYDKSDNNTNRRETFLSFFLFKVKLYIVYFLSF
jgi:hypothetical protein